MPQGDGVFFAQGRAAAGGDDLTGLPAEAGNDLAFEGAEGRLALCAENFRDRHAGGALDLRVAIDEGAVERFCQRPAQRGLAAAGHADEDDVEPFHAQRGVDVRGALGVHALCEELLRRQHRLHHQHPQSARGGQAALLGGKHQGRAVRVVDNVDDAFEGGQAGDVRGRRAVARVHAHRGGVDKYFRVRVVAVEGLVVHRALAGDGDDLARAERFAGGAGGERSAAAAEDDGLFATNLHAGALDEGEQAADVRVVGDKRAIAVDERVGAADALYFPGEDVAKGQHIFFVGNGDVEAAKVPAFEQGAHTLRGEGAEAVLVAADHVVDALGIAVAELFTDEAVLHQCISS